MNTLINKTALMGLFVALGVTLGYAFIAIPNIEMITAVIFISGYLLGGKKGLCIGIITEAIYSLTNPYGLPSLPLLTAQITAMGFTGLLGGFFGKKDTPNPVMYHIKLGAAGFIASSFFAVLTTLSFTIFMGLPFTKFAAVFLTGIHFYLIHILSNIIIFLFLVPVLLKKSKNYKFIKQFIN